MTAYDYSRSIKTANRLITKFGATAQLLRSIPGDGPDYDPGPPTPDNKDVKAVETEWEEGQVDGTRILESDLRFLIAPGDGTVIPTTENRLQFGGVAYSIVNVKPLAPGAVTVLYDAQCRKA